MSKLGRYNLDTQISTGPVGEVWLASQDGSPASYLVKTFHPGANLLESEQTRGGFRSFVERFRAQKAVADSGSPHWAKVHEIGEVAGGVYVVTDHYPWSAQRMISAGVRPKPATLRAVAEAVARGLADLKTCCGRSHGNLKAVSVLLDEPSVARRVVLSDPAAAEARAVAGPAAEAGDLFALGQLLPELLTGRTVRPMLAFMALDAPEWESLGPAAGPWRDLCEKLVSGDLNRLADLEAGLPPAGNDESPPVVSRVPGFLKRLLRRPAPAPAAAAAPPGPLPPDAAARAREAAEAREAAAAEAILAREEAITRALHDVRRAARAAGIGGPGPRDLAVYISSRREDARHYALLLRDRLTRHFSPGQIFMDFDHAPPGVDPQDLIRREVRRSDVVLALIGRDWLAARGIRRRRLDDPADPIRFEIGLALEQNIRVIPLLVGGATMPEPGDLPGALRPLVLRTGMEFGDIQSFNADMGRIVGVLLGLTR